jgi:starch-binding outer membrane protein SusE/F
MKVKSIYKLLVSFVIVSVLIAACTKESSDAKLDPQLTTTNVLDISSESATVVAFVVAQGDGFIEKGICYDSAAAPTIGKSTIVDTVVRTTASYNVTLTGLMYKTKYYARAYATNTNGTIYGEELTFTTLPIVPGLTTTAVTSITGNSASTGGAVTVSGNVDVTARGVCYGTSHNPTMADSYTVDGLGMGSFTSALTSLKGNTTYYVRAYAVNSAGVGYGPEVSFKTLVDLPVVTTTAVSAIGKDSAVSGGTVTYDGGGTITARGLVWGTSPDPDLTDNVIAAATGGTGEFISNIEGLTMFTTYHVRAYATNSAGTAYGADVSFTTLANTRTWYVPGDYVTASYPGSTYSNWTPASSPYVMSTVSSPDALEGYVYMANTANAFKFTTQADWSGTNYGAGGAADAITGTLSSSGGNFSWPAAYYKINIDAVNLTYTAVAMTWGIIGDATAGGWGTQTNMTYNPTLEVFTIGATLTSGGGLKFRANDDWSYNYGCTAADGSTLDAGGSNIAVSTTGDYAITLDLSTPNEYTYSANRWGLIGDATSGGWTTSTPMTWDATNKVFTVTTTLVAGGFKFRANDAWAINLGGSLTALEQNGANISATAGTYTITLDPWAKVATVSKKK